MLRTKNINVDATRPPTNIQLGRQGENLATCIIFDCTGLVQLYGDGTAELLHELKDGTILSTADNKITYTNTINKLHSGPLGGDQEIGAMIANGKLDVVIFFCDNLITQGHAQDIQALSRLASLYNIAYANNRTTADMIITSPLFTDQNYEMKVPSCIRNYANRFNGSTE